MKILTKKYWQLPECCSYLVLFGNVKEFVKLILHLSALSSITAENGIAGVSEQLVSISEKGKHSKMCLLGRGDVELSGNRFGHSCVHSTKLHRPCLSRLRRFGFVGHIRPRFRRRFLWSLLVAQCERLQESKHWTTRNFLVWSFLGSNSGWALKLSNCYNEKWQLEE